MLIDVKPGKVFELPSKGVKLGILADVIYKKDQMTSYGVKDIAQFIWLLDAKDSDGKNFRVMRQVNQSMADNSTMYATIQEIRGGEAPPVPFDPDTLIGTVSLLGITRTSGVDKKTKKPREYANVNSVNPVEDGVTMALPASFVRDKDIPRDAQGKNIRTQTQGQATAQAQAQQSQASAPATPAAPASNDGSITVDL